MVSILRTSNAVFGMGDSIAYLIDQQKEVGEK